MAIQWGDNFSIYGGNKAFMLNGLYAELTSGTNPAFTTDLVEDPDPNIGTDVLRFGKESSIVQFQNYCRRVFSGSLNEAGVAFRLWLEGLPNDARQFMIVAQFRDATNAGLISVVVGPTGNLLVYQGAPVSVTNMFAGTILGQTSGPVVTANAWQQVQVRAVFDGTVGEVEIQVEGVRVLNLTNVNTQPGATGDAASWQAHNFLASTPAGPPNPYFFYLKDLATWDSFGSYNNGFLGAIVAYPLLPDGDVSLNWTPSTGSNGYSILDNRPPVDAQYISANTTPPAPYLGTLSNLPVDVTSVRAVITTVRAAKVDGGDGNLQVSLVSGADTADGANRPITGAMTFWQDTFEEDPATSAPWTPGAVDAVQVKINRTV